MFGAGKYQMSQSELSHAAKALQFRCTQQLHNDRFHASEFHEAMDRVLYSLHTRVCSEYKTLSMASWNSEAWNRSLWSCCVHRNCNAFAACDSSDWDIWYFPAPNIRGYPIR